MPCSCFDEVIEARVPNYEHRLLIWDFFLNDKKLASDLNKKSHGFVGGDIASICETAAYETSSKVIVSCEVVCHRINSCIYKYNMRH